MEYPSQETRLRYQRTGIGKDFKGNENPIEINREKIIKIKTSGGWKNT